MSEKTFYSPKFFSNTKEQETKIEKGREEESIPTTLYHGSRTRFDSFRIKGRRQPEDLKAQGGKCIFLHESSDTTERKYSKAGGYLYEVGVEDAKNYAEAIEDEGLKSKSPALTDNVWIALPNQLTINKRWRIEPDGSKVLEFEKQDDSQPEK